MKTLKGVLVNTKDNTIKECTLEYNDFLPSIYGLLDCDTIDIVARRFGNQTYSIVCDDEGLFKEKVIPAVITFHDGQVVEQLVGNVFICSQDDEGELASLTHEQVEEICRVQAEFYDEKTLRTCLVAHL